MGTDNPKDKAQSADCRGVRFRNDSPGYDIKQFVGWSFGEF